MDTYRGPRPSASTHNKNPQCLIGPEAQAQAQGSHCRDAVVAVTERHKHFAAFGAAVQSHTAPGAQLVCPVHPPGGTSRSSLH